MVPQKLIGFDADGVLLQFTEAVCADPYFASKGWSVDRFKSYNMKQDMNEAEVAAFEDLIREPGFCLQLERYARAQQAVELSRQFEFYPICVTAPLTNSHTWMAERVVSLEGMFTPKDILFVPSGHKKLVSCCALIEDSAENLEQWLEAHPHGIGCLVNQPWNEDDRLEYRHQPRGTGLLKGGCFRVSDALEAVETIIQWTR